MNYSTSVWNHWCKQDKEINPNPHLETLQHECKYILQKITDDPSLIIPQDIPRVFI